MWNEIYIYLQSIHFIMYIHYFLKLKYLYQKYNNCHEHVVIAIGLVFKAGCRNAVLELDDSFMNRYGN